MLSVEIKACTEKSFTKLKTHFILCFTTYVACLDGGNTQDSICTVIHKK